MNQGKAQIFDWIAQDRTKLIDFLSRFVQARSPNPPGDTRAAAAHVEAYLKAEGLSFRKVSPRQDMPNLIASFEGKSPGRHLVLNGHIDVFPVAETDTWRHGPWSGDVAEGYVWGRGAVDMKCGTTASIFTYAYLNRLRDTLNGLLTLTVVSDEETFGPWGARHLLEHHPEVHGDCCLNGEPSGTRAVRFGEKGSLWLNFNVRTVGAHAAYPHLSESATAIASNLIQELTSLTRLEAALPSNISALLDHAANTVDEALGKGAAVVMRKVTFNVGLIRGGLKVNMIPAECNFEADFRLPIGMTRDEVMARVHAIVARYPQATVEEINFSPPNWCDPEHEMVGILQANVQALRGLAPKPIVGLGGTDTRLWRYRDIPAFVYGPSPRTMGKVDECVEIDEFLHIVQTHAISAYDYLTRA